MMSPQPDHAVDLRPYIAGLPPAITREYLQGLTPAQHADLVQKVGKSLAGLRDETIRAQAAIAQREQEMAAIVRDAQEQDGISTLDEAKARLAEAEDRVLACWQDVAAALSPKG